MDELHDVSAQNPANNDGLFYNTTSGLWEKKSIATALGYTPANKAGDTFTGVVSIYNSNDAQLYLNGNGTSWAGISWADVSGTDYMWYNGSTSTFAIGGGGSFVANKKLHVHGGMTIGSGIAASASGTNSLLVEASITANQIYGQIFYDSQNGAYYVDPASSSNLYSATVNSVLVLPAAAGTNSFFVGTGDGASLSTYNFGLSGWNGMAFYNPTTGGAFPNATTGFLAFRDGYIEMRGSLRAPIFYDSNNTAYYTDPASTSVLNNLSVNGGTVFRSDWTTRFQSPSDFTDGTLVTTDIPATAWAGDSFVIEITGKSYDQNNPPFKVIAQGYLYNDTIINYSGISYAGNFASYIKVFQDGGVLKFWWPRISYWNSFNVNVMSMDGQTNGTITRNRVTAIGNSTEPTGTKKQQINLIKFLRSTETAAKATDLNQARYVNNDFNTLGTSPQVFRAYSNYIPSGGSYNQPPNGAGDYKVLQWGDVEGGSSGNWGGQIVQNFYDDRMWFRRSYGTTWQAWREFIHDGNYTSYAMPSGASATNSVDVRAPIFYDSNNTAYYFDGTGGTRQSKFLTINGNTGGNNGNELVVGNNAVTYSLTDTNLRPVIQAHGAYPVLSLNHTITANTLHGPTVQFTANGTGKQFVIGMSGNGSQLDIGNSAATDWNPHNGIGGYNGITGWRMDGAGNVYNLISSRSPIYYDNDNTGFYIDPAGTSTIGNLRTGNVINMGGWNESIATSAFRGIEFHNEGGRDYYIGKPAGAWTQPLAITFYTGIHYRASQDYGGSKFYNANNGSMLFSIGDGDGSVRVTNDIRSPIFYDSNNTGFYVDPAGFSQMSSANGMWMCGTTNPADTVNGSTWYGTGRNNLDQVQLAGYYGIRFRTAGVIMDLAGDYAQINGSYRAPIFYDSNNTAYYWDFADNAVSHISTTIVGMARYRTNFGSSAYSGGQSSPILQVFSDDGGTAMFSFHRGNHYAVNMGLDPDNVLRIGGWSASANRFQMDMSGNLTMAGNVTAYSDGRLKDNVATVSDALELVEKMRGVTYTRKDTGEAGVGVIAQEMLEVLPEVVQQGIGDDDTLSVAYGNLVGVLIEAIKELSLKVKTLEEKDNSK
jgi:hypothetical protein